MLTVLALAAAVASSPITVVDDDGRTVSLPRSPRRIVSTAPSNTSALFALGAGDRLVGITSWCRLPDGAPPVEVIGRFSTIDLEAVLGLEPDLVVATGSEQRRYVARLQELGLPVLVLYPTDLDGVMRSLRALGRALGQERRARELVAGLRARLRVIDEKVRMIAAADRPRVFVKLSWNPLYTAGPGSTVHEAIERAGGRNIATDIDKPYSTFSREVVIARDPEVVLLGMNADQGAVAEQAGFAGLTAVRDGRIHRLEPHLLFHHNHQLVDGIEELFRLFHGAAVDRLGEAGDGLRGSAR